MCIWRMDRRCISRFVSTLLEILADMEPVCKKKKQELEVSTLLEILVYCKTPLCGAPNLYVSTLLEILAPRRGAGVLGHEAVLVSTLLEILGLVWLVLVGF